MQTYKTTGVGGTFGVYKCDRCGKISRPHQRAQGHVPTEGNLEVWIDIKTSASGHKVTSLRMGCSEAVGDDDGGHVVGFGANCYVAFLTGAEDGMLDEQAGGGGTGAFA